MKKMTTAGRACFSLLGSMAGTSTRALPSLPSRAFTRELSHPYSAEHSSLPSRAKLQLAEVVLWAHPITTAAGDVWWHLPVSREISARSSSPLWSLIVRAPGSRTLTSAESLRAARLSDFSGGRKTRLPSAALACPAELGAWDARGEESPHAKNSACNSHIKK